MPNIKSAKKRVKVIEKKTLRNSMIKSEYKSAIKRLIILIHKVEKLLKTEHFLLKDYI